MSTVSRVGTSTGEEKSPRHDIRALTGLRIVAATLVVLLHFQHPLRPYLDQVPVLRSVVSAGWLGVDLFFVLSGFVIALSYLDRLGHRPRLRTVRDFLVGRFARVWPAWAVVTVLMGAWVWGMRRIGANPDVFVGHPDADLLVMLRQLTMTQVWDQSTFENTSYVLPGWSVSAEWLAYLCFPLLALALRPLRRLPAAVLATASCLAMAPLAVIAFRDGVPDGEQNWALRILCGFTAGVLAALAFRRIERTDRLAGIASGATTVLVVWIAGIFLWSNWRRAVEAEPTADYSGVAVVLFPLLILSLSFADRGVASFLARPAMVYGGRISYCLYLVHFVVLDVVTTMVFQRTGAWEFTPGYALVVPAMVVACFLLSAALHHGVEEPARVRVLALLGSRPARTATTRGRSAPASAPVGGSWPASAVPVARGGHQEPVTGRLVLSVAPPGRPRPRGGDRRDGVGVAS